MNTFISSMLRAALRDFVEAHVSEGELLEDVVDEAKRIVNEEVNQIYSNNPIDLPVIPPAETKGKQ